MGTISVSLPSDGTTADVTDYNTPITTIVDEINGNLDNANIDAAAAIAGTKLADSAISTVKIEDDAVTAAKMANGLIARRQGGSSTNWHTAGTTTYDTSASDVKIQCGTIASNANPKAVTFPTAFTNTPLVMATVLDVSSTSCFAVVISPSNTGFSVQVYDNAGSTNTAQTVSWIALGI